MSGWRLSTDAVPALGALALVVAAVVPTASQPTFRSRVELVRVDVLVSDRNGPVTGLMASDFEIRDNGVLQEIHAVRSHQPGVPDEAVAALLSIPPEGLEALTPYVVTLADQASRNHRSRAENLERDRFALEARKLFPRADYRDIVSLAAALSPPSAQPEPVTVDRFDRFLLRGATLHADAAMLFQSELESAGRAFVTSGEPSKLRFRFLQPLYVSPMSDRNDVKRLAISGFHWQIARWLLTFASQRPAATDSLRLWYSATTAFMADDQNFPELTPHLSEATRLLPDDALLTFFHGWLHETLASPPVQNHREAAAAGRPMPSRTSRAHECDLRRCDRSEELALAERLMTQALERDPQLVQARVRLGHVLAERGRHVQAVDQLHRALDGSLDRVTTFEALLFLGGSQEALGRIELAADAYRRALALFPFAQSARVALSHLHSGQGAHSDAAAALRAMPPRDGSAASDRDDPWWTYHLGPGRTSDDTIGRLHALISALPPE